MVVVSMQVYDIAVMLPVKVVTVAILQEVKDCHGMEMGNLDAIEQHQGQDESPLDLLLAEVLIDCGLGLVHFLGDVQVFNSKHLIDQQRLHLWQPKKDHCHGEVVLGVVAGIAQLTELGELLVLELALR